MSEKLREKVSRAPQSYDCVVRRHDAHRTIQHVHQNIMGLARHGVPRSPAKLLIREPRRVDAPVRFSGLKRELE